MSAPVGVLCFDPDYCGLPSWLTGLLTAKHHLRQRNTLFWLVLILDKQRNPGI
jgi:hypothetical protein